MLLFEEVIKNWPGRDLRGVQDSSEMPSPWRHPTRGPGPPGVGQASPALIAVSNQDLKTNGNHDRDEAVGQRGLTFCRVGSPTRALFQAFPKNAHHSDNSRVF